MPQRAAAFRHLHLLVDYCYYYYSYCYYYYYSYYGHPRDSLSEEARSTVEARPHAAEGSGLLRPAPPDS